MFCHSLGPLPLLVWLSSLISFLFLAEAILLMSFQVVLVLCFLQEKHGFVLIILLRFGIFLQFWKLSAIISQQAMSQRWGRYTGSARKGVCGGETLLNDL
jgi:hypothetical protein